MKQLTALQASLAMSVKEANTELFEKKDIVCTAENPWDRVKRPGVRVVHPDAVEGDQRDGYPGGDMVEYTCPHCKKTFEIELPQ